MATPPPIPGSLPPAGAWQLTLRRSDGATVVYALGAGQLSFGGAKNCDVQLEGKDLTSVCCLFTMMGARPGVLDQGTRKIFTVNGRRMRHAWLQEGDRVEIGSARITVARRQGRRTASTVQPHHPRGLAWPANGDVARSHLGVIYRLGTLLSSTAAVEKASETIAAIVLEALPLERVFVLLAAEPSDEEQAMKIVASLTRHQAQTDGGQPSQTVLDKALSTGKGLYRLDVAADSSLRMAQSLHATEVRAILCAPMKQGTALIGALYADSRSRPDVDFEAMLALFEGVADQAALALGRAQLHASLVREHGTVLRQRDQLDQLNRHLEHRIQEATAQIEEQAALLAQRVAELEDLHKTRELMARTLTHDIKNLAGAVVSNLAFLEDQVEASSDEAAATSDARLGIEAIVAMAEDLLSLSQMEHGTLQLDLRPCLTDELFESARHRLGGAARDREVTLVHSPSNGNRTTVNVDPYLFGRVLDNLVGNALRYAGAGGRVSLSSTSVDREVRVVVADTGPGIPADEQKRVFDQWYQVQGASRRHHGQGLYFCRLAVEAHGGTIHVEGLPGNNRFVVALPLSSPESSSQ